MTDRVMRRRKPIEAGGACTWRKRADGVTRRRKPTGGFSREERRPGSSRDEEERTGCTVVLTGWATLF
jgi:hypothetical protein